MPSLFGSPQVRLWGSLFILLFSLTSLLVFFQDSVFVVKGPSIFNSSGSSGNHSLSTHEPALQHDPPPDNPPFGALVIAAKAETDLSWTEFSKAYWEVYDYDVNNPDNEDPRLRFPQSKGHEAMVYLSFIIDHYDDLPWCTLFIHGHTEAWHQEDDIAVLISALDHISLARQGYISLRCDWYPSCPAEMRPVHHDAIVWGPGVHTKGTEIAIAQNWQMLFPDEKMPETIASLCCAQFAVTRQAIIRRPKADYERLRQWLITSLLEDSLSGRVLEKLWAYIFTGNGIHVAVLHQSNAHVNGSVAVGLATGLRLRKSWHKYQTGLKHWRSDGERVRGTPRVAHQMDQDPVLVKGHYYPDSALKMAKMESPISTL